MNLPVMTPAIGLDEAMHFAWLEADLLDHACYDEWLALWTPQARYVVPIDPAATEFEDCLNYIYDDHEMRRKRTERLVNGQLLKAAGETGFEVLLTTDKNMASQQNLKTRTIAIMVLGNSPWRVVQRYVRRIAASVNAFDVL